MEPYEEEAFEMGDGLNMTDVKACAAIAFVLVAVFSLGMLTGVWIWR